IMNRVTHFEIYTDDPEAVQPFYRDVFGWKFQKFEDGPMEYWLVTTGDDKEPGINGGLTRPREGQSPGTLNTVAVASLDQTIRKIEQRGGKSWRQLQDVVYELYDRQKPFLRRNVCRTDATRTHSLYGQI